MKIKEVRMSIKYVRNLGNYQSYTAEAGATIELEPGETPSAVFATGWDMVKGQVREQIKSVKEVTR